MIWSPTREVTEEGPPHLRFSTRRSCTLFPWPRSLTQVRHPREHMPMACSSSGSGVLSALPTPLAIWLEAIHEKRGPRLGLSGPGLLILK